MSNIITISKNGTTFILKDPDTGAYVTVNGEVIIKKGFISIEPVEELFLSKFPHKIKCKYSEGTKEALWALLDSNCREDNWGGE